MTGRYAHRVLLVDLNPLHVPSGLPVPFYVASEFFATGPLDSPASVQYTGCVKDDVFVSRSMFAGERVGGRSLPDFGQVTVVNPLEPVIGSRFDAWLDPEQYAWQSTPIAMHLMLDGDFAGKITVFTGLVADLDYQESEIGFRLKSLALALDKPLQPNRYAGTGGAEGGAELAAKPKPRLFGIHANIEPVIVDSATYLTQFHDGAAQAVDALRDKGAPLTSPTDYTLTLASGQIDIVAQPQGRLTADARGSTLGGSYSARPADILGFIAGEKGVSLDSAALAALALAAPYDLGYYATAEVNTLDALDAIVNAYGGWHGVNRAGAFDAGIFGNASGDPALDLTEDDIELGSLQRAPLGAVAWKVIFNYRPNGVAQPPDELVPEPTLSQADRSRYGTAYQKTVVVEDAAIKDTYPDAVELTFESLLYGDDDALAEATRQFDYWKVPRSKYTMRVRGLAPLAADLGDVVRLTHSRLGLAAGKDTEAIEFTEYYLKGGVDLTLAG